MPAFGKAISSALLKENESEAVYHGTIDSEWLIFSVPNGGYSLSIIVNAAQAFMRRGKELQDGHYDPFHVAATFLSAAEAADYEVEVILIKKGRGFSNLEARFFQPHHKTGKPLLRISTHIIMTSFAARARDDSLGPTIPQGHSLYRQCPIRPPSDCVEDKTMQNHRYNMRNRIHRVVDSKTRFEELQKGHLRWGAWMSILHEDEIPTPKPGIGNNFIPYFADMMETPPWLLPAELRLQKGDYWFPTLQLSIEFKRPIPYDSPLTRVGLAMACRFINQGQHEVDGEVWSHPDDAAKLGLPPDAGSQILAISRQVALAIDASINKKQDRSAKM